MVFANNIYKNLSFLNNPFKKLVEKLSFCDLMLQTFYNVTKENEQIVKIDNLLGTVFHNNLQTNNT